MVFDPKNSTFSLLRQDFKNKEITRLQKQKASIRHVFDNGIVLDANKSGKNWEKTTMLLRIIILMPGQ